MDRVGGGGSAHRYRSSWHAGYGGRGEPLRRARCSRRAPHRGNQLLPTQVLITPSSVVQYTPYWIGRHEETIHMAHVSSAMIDTGCCSRCRHRNQGGSDPIRCYGHHKGDAARMKTLIEQYQTEYYRAGGAAPAVVPEPKTSERWARVPQLANFSLEPQLQARHDRPLHPVRRAAGQAGPEDRDAGGADHQRKTIGPPGVLRTDELDPRRRRHENRAESHGERSAPDQAKETAAQAREDWRHAVR